MARSALLTACRLARLLTACRLARLLAVCRLSGVLLLASCGSHASPSSSAGTAAPATTASSPQPSPSAGLPRADGTLPSAPSNPLGLPPMKVNLDSCRRVFTFSDQMMAAARPGATLVLSAATVASLEGDDLVIEGRGRPSYKVHPGYVIPVPDQPRLRLRDAVLTEHDGLMKHAVVTRFVKERVAVRYTDVPGKTPEALLLGSSTGPPTPEAKETTCKKAARFVRQVEGLAPGSYAALRQENEWLHVLLVSSWGEGEARRWLALGFGGAAMIVAEADLRPIPVRYSPKLGSIVWAEWAGKLRRATVQSADEPGLFTVKYERAGRPAVVGWGSWWRRSRTRRNDGHAAGVLAIG